MKNVHLQYLLLGFTLLLSGCVSNAIDSPFVVRIDEAISFDWGVRDNGDILYQNDGIPGNLANFPGTLTPQNTTLKAIVLGPPLVQGQRVEVRVLGAFEQASSDGLISTIIATTDATYSLEELENQNHGALAVVEAGIQRLSERDSRPLGYRPSEIAMNTIYQSRKEFKR